MSSIAWLETVGAGELALVGGKAANLGELIRAGFDVPPGFVVTTKAYHRRNPDGSVPAVVADEIRVAWGELVGDTGAAVAVRSSATAEDLAEASFAGQQETFLGVQGEDAVVAAVADCWASLFSERAVAYRRQHEVDETALAMAVVVQLMVDARAAGVMFTANPVNGQRRQTVITAAPGLGEAVVSGTVTPDSYLVGRDTWQVLSANPGGAATGSQQRPTTLTADQAIALARLGAEIETRCAARPRTSSGRWTPPACGCCRRVRSPRCPTRWPRWPTSGPANRATCTSGPASSSSCRIRSPRCSPT